jgi:hypothetical protein
MMIFSSMLYKLKTYVEIRVPPPHVAEGDSWTRHILISYGNGGVKFLTLLSLAPQ